jgi:transposase
LPDWHYIHKELRRPGVTLVLLWLEYKETHPADGYSYSQFCHHYRAFEGRLDLVMRQEHRAGEKLFVDFPGQRLPMYDRRTGDVVIKAELFVAVLGASNYLYAEAVASQELSHWVAAHVHAFEAMGSVPEIVVCDNLRAGVKQAHRYEPEINATYADMAAHYGVAIIPTRSGKPRDKAKVEAGVLLAERWILARLRNRRFYSLAEANAVIRELVTAINERSSRRCPARDGRCSKSWSVR